MKQHITIDQLNELSDRGKEKLREWCVSNIPIYMPELRQMDYSTPIENLNKLKEEIIEENMTLSIGQMIEFLGWLDMEFYVKTDDKWKVQNGAYENASKSFVGDELCDALWQAVREVLEEK